MTKIPLLVCSALLLTSCAAFPPPDEPGGRTADIPASPSALPPGGPGADFGPGNMPPPPGAMPPDGMPAGDFPPPPGGFHAHVVTTGTGAYVLADGQKLQGGVYASVADDENALRIDGNISAILNDVSVQKTAGRATSNEGASFYGLNAAILALNGADLTINGGDVKATSEGATGVFAYNRAHIHINNTKLDVSGGNAGGIEVAGGGEIDANNLTVNARDKAAIRSDRGGGIIRVNGGTYTTKGSMGAPAIYSTADIRVKDASLISHDSEAVVIEGFNSVTLTNTDVTGRMRGQYGSPGQPPLRNIMLYQSMSGDAKVGTSRFTMNGGSLASENGDMFYVTNTRSVINLNKVHLSMEPRFNLLVVAGNHSVRRWGRVGHNGGDCVLNMNQQQARGDIRVDGISSLTVNLKNGTRYRGAINYQRGDKAHQMVVNLDNSSVWMLTGNSSISEFHGDRNHIMLNGYKLDINGVPMHRQ